MMTGVGALLAAARAAFADDRPWPTRLRLLAGGAAQVTAVAEPFVRVRGWQLLPAVALIWLAVAVTVRPPLFLDWAARRWGNDIAVFAHRMAWLVVWLTVAKLAHLAGSDAMSPAVRAASLAVFVVALVVVAAPALDPRRWRQVNCTGTANTPDADRDCQARVRAYGLTLRAADRRAVSKALGRGWTITEVDGVTYDRCPEHLRTYSARDFAGPGAIWYSQVRKVRGADLRLGDWLDTPDHRGARMIHGIWFGGTAAPVDMGWDASRSNVLTVMISAGETELVRADVEYDVVDPHSQVAPDGTPVR